MSENPTAIKDAAPTISLKVARGGLEDKMAKLNFPTNRQASCDLPKPLIDSWKDKPTFGLSLNPSSLVTVTAYDYEYQKNPLLAINRFPARKIEIKGSLQDPNGIEDEIPWSCTLFLRRRKDPRIVATKGKQNGHITSERKDKERFPSSFAITTIRTVSPEDLMQFRKFVDHLEKETSLSTQALFKPQIPK